MGFASARQFPPGVRVDPIKRIDRSDVVILRAQGRVTAVSTVTRVPGGLDLNEARGGIRGEIAGFSQASRRRLLNTLGRLEPKQAAGMLHFGQFVTLTFGQRWPDYEETKACFKRFRTRLQRRWKGVSAMWRVELQARGAPHYHLMIFGIAWLDHTEIRRMWAGCVPLAYWDHSAEVGPPSFPICEVKGIKSLRGVAWYVSKYIAKPVEETDDGDDGDDGGAWLGRHWGYIDRGRLPWASWWAFAARGGDWVYQFARLVRRATGSRGFFRGGFGTLYGPRRIQAIVGECMAVARAGCGGDIYNRMGTGWVGAYNEWGSPGETVSGAKGVNSEWQRADWDIGNPGYCDAWR